VIVEEVMRSDLGGSGEVLAHLGVNSRLGRTRHLRVFLLLMLLFHLFDLFGQILLVIFLFFVSLVASE
jgi:hypothetical protein